MVTIRDQPRKEALAILFYSTGMQINDYRHTSRNKRGYPEYKMRNGEQRYPNGWRRRPEFVSELRDVKRCYAGRRHRVPAGLPRACPAPGQ
jgi:hypothetical protein